MDIDIPLYLTGNAALDIILGILIGLGAFQVMMSYLNAEGEKN
jgi:hypothetical protein